jgi:hypothetical protein
VRGERTRRERTQFGAIEMLRVFVAVVDGYGSPSRRWMPGSFSVVMRERFAREVRW